MTQDFSLFILESPLLPLFFLFGFFLLTVCMTAFIRLGKFRAKEALQNLSLPIPFWNLSLKTILVKQEWDSYYLIVSLSRHIYQLLYTISSLFFCIALFMSRQETNIAPKPLVLISSAAIIIVVFICFDALARLCASIWSRTALRIAAPIAFLYLLLLFPLTGLILKMTEWVLRKTVRKEEKRLTDKAKLKQMIQESELARHLDLSDLKLIGSFINFKERVAKEIMVPRVDLFSLSSDTSIKEASLLFSQEGYSRIPIYRDTLDQIVGVVLYKDLLKYYTSSDQNLNEPLEKLAKPVLYAPENKKISQLLQEFRSQQIHMAIIVDEYGGTEGIVTIEDILEELVGEIEDEYDIDEEHPFLEIPGGGWIIDAKMTLLDIAEQLGIHIPTHPEYETLGGYIYHCAGTIPSKGWRLSHDAFDLEVISSNERAIKKVKITPRTHPQIS